MSKARILGYSALGLALCASVSVAQVMTTFTPDKDNAPPTTTVKIWKRGGIDNAINNELLGRLMEGKELYSLNLLHRTGEEVTIHGTVVDLYFIQKGTAVLESGGTAVNAKLSGGRAGDQRAESMKGSTFATVEAGDIVFIPPGVPHRFVKGKSDIVYFNVHFPGK